MLTRHLLVNNKGNAHRIIVDKGLTSSCDKWHTFSLNKALYFMKYNCTKALCSFRSAPHFSTGKWHLSPWMGAFSCCSHRKHIIPYLTLLSYFTWSHIQAFVVFFFSKNYILQKRDGDLAFPLCQTLRRWKPAVGKRRVNIRISTERGRIEGTVRWSQRLEVNSVHIHHMPQQQR